MNSWDEYVSVNKYKRERRRDVIQFSSHELQELTSSVCRYALASHSNARIYLSGGNESNSFGDSEGEECESVYSLDIHDGTWHDEPSLNVGRAQHSSCVEGDKLFVFAGDLVASIEMLDISARSTRATATW